MKPVDKPVEKVDETEGEVVPFALSVMRRGMRKAPVRQVSLAGLPAAGRPGLVLPRESGWAEVPSLKGVPQSVVAIGAGGAGKTVAGRLLATLLSDAGQLNTAAFFSADLGVRMLPLFVANTAEPESDREEEVERALGDWFDWWADAEGDRVRFGYCDSGGNNTALRALARRRKGLAERVAKSGAALVPFHCLTPRVDDLGVALEFDALWKPEAQALLLNLATADRGLASFDTLRGQDGYRALLAKGAVELVVPKLDERVAQRIEEDRLPFHMARDGKVPKGSDARPLDEEDQTVLAEWLRDVWEAWRPATSRGWVLG